MNKYILIIPLLFFMSCKNNQDPMQDCYANMVNQSDYYDNSGVLQYTIYKLNIIVQDTSPKADNMPFTYDAYLVTYNPSNVIYGFDAGIYSIRDKTVGYFGREIYKTNYYTNLDASVVVERYTNIKVF
jgi:hypothetical protein